MATKKATKTKATKKPAKKKAPPRDLRSEIQPTAANLTKTLKSVQAALDLLEKPAEPHPGDLVDAMLHATFSRGIPCGYAQEAVRRIYAEYVDRNEFRVTEAYEVEELLADLEMPDAFECCRVARNSVGEVYNDQNSVQLEFLREATVSDRKSFFQRVPSIPPEVVRYLQTLLAFEELAFSQRSTMRVQVRLGLDPNAAASKTFVASLREMLAPFGHLPMLVGASSGDGKPVTTPPLCPACQLVRLGPPGGKRG